MATSDFELAKPPTKARARDLWLQHAAGFIRFEDARQYAFEQIDPKLSASARAAVEKGINDAIYGLMMVIDGVTGSLSNSKFAVDVRFTAQLIKRVDDEDGEVLREVDLHNGDGMCMGYHGWLEGDFGEDDVAVQKSGE